MAPRNPTPTVHLAASASSPIDWELVSAKEPTTPITDLVLQPGQQGDLSVLLRNDSNHHLDVHLVLRGDFPAAWFTPHEDDWHIAPDPRGNFSTRAFQVQPRETLYKNLSFTLPEDFFEPAQAQAIQNKMPIQYASELFLYQRLSTTDGTPEADSEDTLEDTPEDASEDTDSLDITAPFSVRLIGHQPFQLYTRPTRTYLEFLPEIYQQSDFLGRFLSIAEQAFEPTYEATENFWAYLNPLTAPKALVPFLAHWVAWPMNPRWTLRQQRRLIRHAVEIYQWRGTRRGLQLCLHLCTDLPLDDEHIEIAEADEAGFTLGEETCRLGDEPCLGGGMAYHFAVTLRPQNAAESEKLDETMLREIIEQEKPAFCTYDLTILDV